MKIVKSAMITEHIPLSSCRVGDTVYIPYTKEKRGCGSIGNVIIVKIKRIHRNLIQIKYNAKYHSSGSKNIIQKKTYLIH